MHRNTFALESFRFEGRPVSTHAWIALVTSFGTLEAVFRTHYNMLGYSIEKNESTLEVYSSYEALNHLMDSLFLFFWKRGKQLCYGSRSLEHLHIVMQLIKYNIIILLHKRLLLVRSKLLCHCAGVTAVQQEDQLLLLAHTHKIFIMFGCSFVLRLFAPDRFSVAYSHWPSPNRPISMILS